MTTLEALIAVAALAVVEGLLCGVLIRRVDGLKRRLDIAVSAAEDAARAAAMSAPGGIDPEVVMTLLRAGQPVSLDAVYAIMERQNGPPPAVAS